MTVSADVACDARDAAVPQDGLRMIYVEMFAACDMSCPMCVTLPHRDGHRTLMSRRHIRERILEPAADRGMRRVIFGGGEPTLRPDVLDILDDAVACGFHIWLATNLGQMTDDRLRSLLSHIGRGSHTIAVSFDSRLPAEMNAIRGKAVFDAVDRNCRRLVELRNEMGADVVLANTLIVQRDNVQSVDATIDYVLDDVGFDIVHVYPRHDYRAVTPDNFRDQRPSDWCREHERALMALGLRLYHRARTDHRLYLQGSLADWINFVRAPQQITRRCDAGRMLFINPEGVVRSCMFGTPYANITTDTLDTIVASDDHAAVRRFQDQCRICHLSSG